MSLPSSLFPSIDLTYIEDKYSRLSTQALLDAFSSLRGIKRTSTPVYSYNETEVHGCFIYFFFFSTEFLIIILRKNYLPVELSSINDFIEFASLFPLILRDAMHLFIP